MNVNFIMQGVPSSEGSDDMHATEMMISKRHASLGVVSQDLILIPFR